MAASGANEEVARLRAEVARLQRGLSDEGFVRDLRDTLTLASVTGVIGAPVSHRSLMQLIVATAADLIGAAAAALFLVDAGQEHLIFQVLFRDRSWKELDDFQVPIGEGIAGSVALTGQSMSITDEAGDDVDVADVAERLGLVPKHILCVPLSLEDEVLGVLLFVNGQADGSFSIEDMGAVTLFSNLAAVSIEQSRTESRMTALLAQLVEGVDAVPDYDPHGLTERARAFTAELGQETGYLTALDLARLVQEIVRHGDAATRACRGVLDSFGDYLRVSSTRSGDPGGAAWLL